MKSNNNTSQIFLGIFIVLWLSFSGLVYYVHTEYETTKRTFFTNETELKRTVEKINNKKKRLQQVSNLVGYYESYRDGSLKEAYNYIEISPADKVWENSDKMRTSLDALITKIELVCNEDDKSTQNKIAFGVNSLANAKIDAKQLLNNEEYSRKVTHLEDIWNAYTKRITELQETIKTLETSLQKKKDEYTEILSTEKEAIAQTEKEIEVKKGQISDLRTEKEELLKEEEEKRNTAQEENEKERNRLSELNEQEKLQEKKYKNKIADLEQRISELKDEAAGQSGISRWFQNQKENTNKQDIPDGEIIYVNENLNIAYIDIGRNQGAVPGLQFDIFRYGKGGEKIIKGKAEIKKVDDKMSMVGITELADTLNPINSGDKIINSVYDRNKTKYFVVAGKLIQKYSLQQVKRMVSNIGGTVEDEITAKTDFVILGEDFENDSIYTRAEQLGIETMLEAEFVNHLDNWKN